MVDKLSVKEIIAGVESEVLEVVESRVSDDGDFEVNEEILIAVDTVVGMNESSEDVGRLLTDVSDVVDPDTLFDKDEENLFEV